MALKVILFMLAVGNVTFAALITDECPPRMSTSCFCRFQKGLLSSACSRIENQQVLEDSIRAHRGYSLQWLDLIEDHVPRLPEDLFHGLHVKELRLHKCEFDDASSFSPGKTHFQGLESSLEKLYMFDSFKDKQPFTNLKLDHLHSLKVIHFLGNSIPEIGNECFASGPQGLLELYAVNNDIGKLGDKAFASLTNLRKLELEVNKLEEISRSMLPSPANHLHTLDLARNKLRTLPRDIFSRMPALKLVLIDKNMLQTLPEDTFSPIISQLRHLNFLGNPLRCDQDLKWLCDQKSHTVSVQCAAPPEKKGLYLDGFCEQ